MTMAPSTYRDMHMLDLVAQKPDLTQRELSTRIGAALGLTNLMLRRLAKKGYIKISGTKRSRIRYLITPKGILEKTRLTYEFVHYSLQLYRYVRHGWREQLAAIAQTGQRRILLYGTGELAEIAFLTVQEMGLEFIGVAQETADRRRFLNHSLQNIRQVPADSYDWILVTALQDDERLARRLRELGIPQNRTLILPRPGAVRPVSERRRVERLDATATEPMPVLTEG